MADTRVKKRVKLSEPKPDFSQQALPTRRQAANVARLMGCSGAHQVGDKWMPCASAEQLEALFEGGVRAYRVIRDKGLLGRSLGEMRQVVRGGAPNIGGGKRSSGKKKRVRYNPKARDSDGDGLIQDNTTAERRAGSAVEGGRSAKPKRRTVVAPKQSTRKLEARAKPSSNRTILKPKKKTRFPEAPDVTEV